MEDALLKLTHYFDTTPDILKDLLYTNFNLKCSSNNIVNNNNVNNVNKTIDCVKKTEIILPYYGKIFPDRCKGLVYNHGLYTQCKENCLTNDFCKKCKNNKYGSVYDRQKYDIGKYITPSGKKEMDYNNFIVKMNYNINDVRDIFIKNRIKYGLVKSGCNVCKRRGRPCKVVCDDKKVMVEVERKKIGNIDYLITMENVVLDINSYDIKGLLVDNRIVEYN